jgi:hypothetical protein
MIGRTGVHAIIGKSYGMTNACINWRKWEKWKANRKTIK